MDKIVFYFLIIIVTACNPTLHEKNVIYVDIDKTKSIHFSEWFSEIEIIPLETHKSSVISECHKMDYAHQRFYVHDLGRGAIFVFDSIGKFLFSTLPLKGKGPGEYVGISDFCINKFTGNIEILDPNSLAIRVYDKDFSLIKNIKLIKDLFPLGTFQQLSADLYLFCSPDYEKTQTAIKVFSISQKKIIKRLLPLPANTKDLSVTNTSNFSWLNNNVLFSYKFPNNDVFHIDTIGDVVAYYKYDFEKYTFNLDKLPANQEKSYYRRYYETFKDKYAFPYKKPENLKYRFCFFVFKDDLYISRQEKESLHQEVISHKFRDGGMILPPIYIDEKYLYNAVEPDWLELMLTKDVLTLVQQEMISKIKEEDNPVILKYKIKSL